MTQSEAYPHGPKPPSIHSLVMSAAAEILPTQTLARVHNPGPNARFVLEHGQGVPLPLGNQVLVQLQVAGLWYWEPGCLFFGASRRFSDRRQPLGLEPRVWTAAIDE